MRSPVGSEDLGAIPVYMPGNAPLLHVAIHESPDGPFQPSPDRGLLKAEKGQFPSPACPAERGGRIKGIQIGSDRENEGYNIRFVKAVLPEQGVI
jgi:hypothetical protein